MQQLLGSTQQEVVYIYLVASLISNKVQRYQSAELSIGAADMTGS